MKGRSKEIGVGLLNATIAMFSFSYPALFRRDTDGRSVVSCPDFPGAHTDGKDLQEALEEAIDCLGSVLAFRISEKNEIPAPSGRKRGQRLVPVPLWIAGKLAFYLAMREHEMSNSELARRLGVRETVVRRMLDPDHETRSEKLQAALAVLGKRIVVAMENAAW
ncbi:MAG: type II toxin-antitoxin system HicB family antitoxin [bacterium]|nr:type II toxin-antitoxin system HicB family antitoxin [bacterium]